MNEFTLVCGLISCLPLVFDFQDVSAGNPTLEIYPKSQNITEGDSAAIKCELKGYNSSNGTILSTHWFKIGSSRVLANGALLNLANTSRNDTGAYLCKLNNGTSNWDQKEAFINVQYPAQIVSIPNKTVNESDYVHIVCRATGNPTPQQVAWRKPDNSTSVNKQLKIKNVTREAAGWYFCEAQNEIGAATERIHLTVQYRPNLIEPTLPKQTHYSWLNDTIVLQCIADGCPAPLITWYKNDQKMTMGKNYMVSPHDFGVFVCDAKNILGSQNASFQINRWGFPPSAPTITNRRQRLCNRSLTLTWSDPPNGNRPIIKYTVYCQEISSNGTMGNFVKLDTNELQLTQQLSMETILQCFVTASNDQGEGNWSIPMNFTVMSCSGPPANPPRAPDQVMYIWIGGACGLAFLGVIIVTIAVCRRRRRRRLKSGKCNGYPSSLIAEMDQTVRNRAHASHQNESKDEVHMRTFSSEPIYANAGLNKGRLEASWEVPRGDVHLQGDIGKGAFSTVAKAFVTGVGTVAVKMPRQKFMESNKKDLLAEYGLLKHLKPHPNVIKLLGAVTVSDPVMVFFEYVPHGDLLGYLRKSRGLHDTYYRDPDSKPTASLTSQQLLKFARGIANGMIFLSENKIIHRDLAARNVLVGEGETCKVTDFGMAREEDFYQKRTRGRLPVRWTAYESLFYGFYTSQSDVWSYGIVLYEIFTIGGTPYPKIQAERIAETLLGGYRMPKPVHLDQEVYALMFECWKTDPELRPTFQDITKSIQRLEKYHAGICGEVICTGFTHLFWTMKGFYPHE